MCLPQLQGQVREPRFASPSAAHAIGPHALRQWAGRPIFASGRNAVASAEAASRYSPRRRPLRIIFPPGMVPIASLPLGLNGLALAWESAAVVAGVLVVGLALGFAG